MTSKSKSLPIHSKSWNARSLDFPIHESPAPSAKRQSSSIFRPKDCDHPHQSCMCSPLVYRSTAPLHCNFMLTWAAGCSNILFWSIIVVYECLFELFSVLWWPILSLLTIFRSLWTINGAFAGSRLFSRKVNQSELYTWVVILVSNYVVDDFHCGVHVMRMKRHPERITR